MSERIIKWGFIGCGEVTKYKSGPAFQKIENSEVVAVMSRNGDKAKTYAKERGIPKWYDDAQELIDDEEVNAVLIFYFSDHYQRCPSCESTKKIPVSPAFLILSTIPCAVASSSTCSRTNPHKKS